MKLAWICYRPYEDTPIIVFEEPDVYSYSKIIQIVYLEIVK